MAENKKSKIHSLALVQLQQNELITNALATLWGKPKDSLTDRYRTEELATMGYFPHKEFKL